MDFDSFATQIRAALRHLHDLVFLVNLPLTRELAVEHAGRDNAARALRSAILESISHLQPALDSALRSADQRGYSILFGRHVQGMSTAELTDELGISVRQLRREEKQALDALVSLMWDRFSPLLEPSPRALPAEGQRNGRSPVMAEAQSLLATAMCTAEDLKQTLAGVLETLAPLIRQQRVQVTLKEDGDSMPVLANRVALRQAILLVLLEALTGLSGGGRLSIKLDYASRQDVVRIEIHAGPRDSESDSAQRRLAMCHDLIAAHPCRTPRLRVRFSAAPPGHVPRPDRSAGGARDGKPRGRSMADPS